ncbi:MAG: prepilin-type N-terminal cleavage/methylation domain-containing protein [Candidatus Margulisiibacteriota bacterium]|nr:prepilin-type N-terminal cleavage/methylation domain-containing protein [Candidatus Margulisiibacteriota bacterium]
MKKGFSLIEVLVAAALTCIIAVSVSFLFKIGTRHVIQTVQMSRASYKAAQKLEELRATPFYKLSSYNGASFDSAKGKVTVVPITSDLAQVIVGYETVEIFTLRSKYQ